jgi:hypothetical protein
MGKVKVREKRVEERKEGRVRWRKNGERRGGGGEGDVSGLIPAGMHQFPQK